MANVKQKTAWLWQNAERILIVAFFLTFSLNIHKVFLTPYSFLNGGFSEYMTMSFSWADLLMLSTITIYTTKSILRQVINSYYASGHGKVFEKSFKNVSRETLYLLIFLGWVGLSIFWSQYQPIAVYRFFTFAEIVLFAILAIKSLNNLKWLKIAFFAVILNGLFQSLMGIAQFIHNSSLGFSLLGESIIGPNIDGVAKILISGEKHIRAYGTFPHPNILAGFLLIPLFMIIGEFIQRKFLPTLSQPSPFQKGEESLPAEEAGARVGRDNVPCETFLCFIPKPALFAILLITGIGFGLTFSRSAFLGLFIGLAIYFIWQLNDNIFSLSPFSKGGLRGISGIQSSKNPSPAIPLQKGERRNYWMFLYSLFFLLIFLFLIFKFTSVLSNQSLQERQLYQIVSYETISGHPVVGVGIGQFILNEYTVHPELKSWQYQPVHNVYLLIFSELGIVGFMFFLLSVISVFLGTRKNERSGGDCILTYSMLYCIILSFLVISLFDHYFWDIKQSAFIFALPLIILSAEFRKEEN